MFGQKGDITDEFVLCTVHGFSFVKWGGLAVGVECEREIMID
jgi:hypothetical protein